MQTIQINENDVLIQEIQDLLSFEKAATELYNNNSAILIVLTHFKAQQWPVFSQKLFNEDKIEIPIFWAVLTAEDQKSFKIYYEIHIGKCLPAHYNNNVPQQQKINITQKDSHILSGCRYSISMNGEPYKLSEKNNDYCKIFGIPDCCYNDIEDTLVNFLTKKKFDKIYCFHESDYFNQKLSEFNLIFLKGGLLPIKYYPYINSPMGFLRGIFTRNQLIKLQNPQWYGYGFNLISEFDINNSDCLRYEDYAIFTVIDSVKYEFLRYILIILNLNQFNQYAGLIPPILDTDQMELYDIQINHIIESLKIKNLDKIKNIFEEARELIDLQQFSKARFIVLDAEFVSILNNAPKIGKRISFPALFCNLFWTGKRDGFDFDINIFHIPCNFCREEECRTFKKGALKYECIIHAESFCNYEIDLIQDFLDKYQNAKIYSFGISDFYQIEKTASFFSSSLEIKKFSQKKHKKKKRIPRISIDLNDNNLSLNEIECTILKDTFPDYKRTDSKPNIQKRLMTKISNENWQNFYSEALQACIDDVISTFLLLLTKEFHID